MDFLCESRWPWYVFAPSVHSADGEDGGAADGGGELPGCVAAPQAGIGAAITARAASTPRCG